MDRFAAMRTFVAIVDGGSLTAGADALDRSQPAVVRTLAALEKHLGVRLLQRTTRRMSLTPEGSDYLERCRQILSDVDEAERALGQDSDELSGSLRITAPVQFGQLHVAPLVFRFLQEHPRVSVDLMFVDRNVDLVSEGIDLALRIGPLPDSGLVALKVGELRRVICASPALLERVGRPAHPSELSSLPCVRMQNLSRSSTWTFERNGKRLPVKVSGAISCNQIAASIAACESSAGFGQFLSYQVDDALRQGRLVRVLQEFEMSDIPVNVVYPGGRFRTARQRAMASMLRDALRERVFRADS